VRNPLLFVSEKKSTRLPTAQQQESQIGRRWGGPRDSERIWAQLLARKNELEEQSIQLQGGSKLGRPYREGNQVESDLQEREGTHELISDGRELDSPATLTCL
jgi:hypothetical protein